MTNVGIHTRAGRERIHTNHVAHALNDETQRKYLQVPPLHSTLCCALSAAAGVEAADDILPAQVPDGPLQERGVPGACMRRVAPVTRRRGSTRSSLASCISPTSPSQTCCSHCRVHVRRNHSACHLLLLAAVGVDRGGEGPADVGAAKTCAELTPRRLARPGTPHAPAAPTTRRRRSHCWRA